VVIENYEEVDVYPLDPEVQEQLLQLQNECAFVWGPKDHWAVGVMMSYVWRDGRFWLTATSQRKRIAAIRRDSRVSVVVSSVGTPLGPAKTVTAKGRCILHEDQETKDWFYPALAAAIMPVNIEVVPEKYISFDAMKLMQDSMAAWSQSGELEESPE
jgi:hypothetical protein